MKFQSSKNRSNFVCENIPFRKSGHIYSSHAGSEDRFTLIEQSYYTVNSYFRIYGVMKQSLLCLDFTLQDNILH